MHLYMTKFYSIKIITHIFHIDNEDGDIGIGYEIIIGQDLMVQLGKIDGFRNNFTKWDVTAVPMNKSFYH